MTRQFMLSVRPTHSFLAAGGFDSGENCAQMELIVGAQVVNQSRGIAQGPGGPPLFKLGGGMGRSR